MKKFSILIVDEDQTSITLLRDILSVSGFSIDVAQSVSECFLKIENTRYDLILMEVKMSEMNGFDACRAIKRSPQNNDIPIIFLTSDNDSESVEQGFECGGVDFITKPFRSKVLMLRVTNHLELKYSRELVKNMNIILEQKVLQRTAELEESLEKLSKAKKELESLSVAKSQLLNMISHEIRTPLNGIIGSMTLIGRYQIPDEINHYFTLLDISVKRLEKFSNTILEASKLRLNGKKILLNREINIIEILTESEKTISAKYPSKIIETKYDLQANDPVVFADRKFLQKCFDAVFENAYKFSPQHETIHVKISENAGTEVVVEISDNGPGFSKSALEYLFQPLSNLESHVDQNTGMGLYLAKVIIDAHSGKIVVGNRETMGAFVEITLPKPV